MTDALETAARRLLYAGLFLSSLLTFRVSGLTLGDLALIASMYLLALSGPARHKRLPVRGGAWVAMAFVLVGGAFAALRADSEVGDFLVVVRLVILIGVLPWQFRRLIVNERQFARAAYSWALGAALCGFGTALQYYGGAGFIPGTDITNAGRYTGFAQHVSDTGGICAAGAALFVAGLITRSYQRRTLNLLGLMGCSLGILLSGSVSALLALSVAFLYLLLRGNFRLGRLIIMTAGVAAAFGLAGTVQNQTSNALSPVERIRQVFGDSASVAHDSSLNTSASRLQSDQLGLHGFYHHPVIGRGVDDPSLIVDHILNLPPHNMIVSALFGGGIFFAVGLLIPVVQALRQGRQVTRREPIGMQVFAAYLASFMFAMTVPSVYNRYFWIPLTLVLIYAARAWEASPPGTRKPRRDRRPSFNEQAARMREAHVARLLSQRG